MKIIRCLFVISLFIIISISLSISEQSFPKIYIDGKLYQGRVLIYKNILYAECDDLMTAVGSKHIYNVPENTHYINNKKFPSENVYVYQNRFYLYLKAAVLFVGATRAEYNSNSNTIIIEFPSANSGQYGKYNSPTATPVPYKVTNFQDLKQGESGFTEHADENKKLDEILKDVEAVLYSKYGMQVPAGLRVISVDKDQLEYMANDLKLGDGLVICGLYTSQDNRIYIGYGLSNAGIYEVMAHEFTHAWQIYNCPPYQEQLMIEGFAEWIGYKYSYGKTGGGSFTNKGNSVYGKGLTFFLNLEAKVGEQGVIDYVKKNKTANLP